MIILNIKQCLANGKFAEIDFVAHQHSSAFSLSIAVEIVKILFSVSFLFAEVQQCSESQYQHPKIPQLVKERASLQLQGHVLFCNFNKKHCGNINLLKTQVVCEILDFAKKIYIGLAVTKTILLINGNTQIILSLE